MLGELSDRQIDLLLQSQLIGRIGCCTGNKTFITPVTYVYHEGYIYAHSKDGYKISVMRRNPEVCFQVDMIENMRNWRSVIVWGEYEELTGNLDQLAGMEILADRFAPFILSETISATHRFTSAPLIVEKGIKAVVYRIKVREKTGRFEKT
jgi:uncharacterized protein